MRKTTNTVSFTVNRKMLLDKDVGVTFKNVIYSTEMIGHKCKKIFSLRQLVKEFDLGQLKREAQGLIQADIITEIINHIAQFLTLLL